MRECIKCKIELKKIKVVASPGGNLIALKLSEKKIIPPSQSSEIETFVCEKCGLVENYVINIGNVI